MRFLIDQNLGRKFTNLLNQAGYDTIFAMIKGALHKAEGKFIVIREGQIRIRIL